MEESRVQLNFHIQKLGKGTIKSPLKRIKYVKDNERVIYEDDYEKVKDGVNGPDFITLEKAGPREKIYFDPKKTKAGIVTCGGLCPGINNVIRALVMQLYYEYGVEDIVGFR